MHTYISHVLQLEDTGTRPPCLTTDTFRFGVLTVVEIVIITGVGDWRTVLEATLLGGRTTRGAKAGQAGITSSVMELGGKHRLSITNGRRYATS